MAEFEREPSVFERTRAGLASARARGRNGGRPYKMTAAKLRLAQAAMGQPGTKVGELCAELGVSRQTLYRHVDHGAHSEPMARSFLGEPIGRIGQPPARRQFLQPPFDLPAVSVLNEDGRHAG